jgi:hypothetical protein
LSYVSVIEILNAEIIDNLKKESEVEERKVNTVVAGSYRILYRSINAKDVKWLD